MSAKLFHNMALNYVECLAALEQMQKPTFPRQDNGTLWCNATWDSVLCWPAIPANTSYSMPCPPLKGLDIEKHIIKYCHASGRWAGKNDTDFSNPSGWTNFVGCMLIDPIAFEVVKEILEHLGAEAMQKAQEIARVARKLEFIGLAVSFLALIVAIYILASFKRLRVFRNMIHLQLMLAILLTIVIRLILYIDFIFTEELGTLQASDVGHTINTTKLVCEAFYFLLEYGKTVAFQWMFIEGFYLHNTLVVRVFQEAPKLWKYLLIGWGVPLIHSVFWLLVLATRREIERCLGSYYLFAEFWILDGVRLAELVGNAVFLLNIVRVLWYKAKAHGGEAAQLMISVKAALMLLPLLGIPNIMQTIPFTPTRHNIVSFAIFTYIASFFYIFQGLMVAVLYCFTNREVNNVIKARYARYRLKHSTADMLRRGSRATGQNWYPTFGRGGGGGGGGGQQQQQQQQSTKTETQPTPQPTSQFSQPSNFAFAPCRYDAAWASAPPAVNPTAPPMTANGWRHDGDGQTQHKQRLYRPSNGALTNDYYCNGSKTESDPEQLLETRPLVSGSAPSGDNADDCARSVRS